MKRALSLILMVILSACAAPVVQEPAAISSATATQRPLPTATLTPQPTATLVENTPTDEAKNEKMYTSCVDPELVDQKDADFEARTGVDLDNPDANPKSRAFADAVKENSFFAYGYEKSEGAITFAMVKTGFGMVDVSEMTGGKINEVVCVYGRPSAVPGETVSVAVGWMDAQNNFHPFDLGMNKVINPEKYIMADAELDFFKQLKDGAVLVITVHTFAGVDAVDGVKSTSDTTARFVDNTKEVQDFIRALDNQMIERAGEERSASAHWDLQDPERGDVGFILAGAWKYVDQVDLQ